MKIATSILSIQDHIHDCLEKINHTDTDYIHLDVMDGKFVSHKTDDYIPLKKLSFKAPRHSFDGRGCTSLLGTLRSFKTRIYYISCRSKYKNRKVNSYDT